MKERSDKLRMDKAANWQHYGQGCYSKRAIMIGKDRHDSLVVDYTGLVSRGAGNVGRGAATAANDPISVVGCLVLCTFFTAVSSLVAVSVLVRFLFAALATA